MNFLLTTNFIFVSRIGLTDRKVPPRVYCDICEEFDLHETEDCPQQTSDDLPAPLPNRTNRQLPEPRPYCEVCEGTNLKIIKKYLLCKYPHPCYFQLCN